MISMMRNGAFLVALLIQTWDHLAASSEAPKIAIVGGGIGGASASHFLRKHFPADTQIDVYEGETVGGRLAVASIDDKEYEIGGSVIHPRNKHMVDFVKLLGLVQRNAPEGLLGLYDGQKYLFEESSWSVITYMKLFWRYGTNLLKLNFMIADLLNHFNRIYELQSQGYAFSSVDKLLRAMNPVFVNMTQISIKDYMKIKSFSEQFIDELVLAITRVNYGQTPDINAFVGAVSLAGAELGLWAIKNGNRLVPEMLLRHSEANVIPYMVKQVNWHDDKFQLLYESSSGASSNGSEWQEEIYDMVIIATPLTSDMSNISFSGFPTPVNGFKGHYHHTVTTLVKGELNLTHFHMTDRLSEILTVNTNLDFNSLSSIDPVDADDEDSVDTEGTKSARVWKIFSQKPLSDDQLDQMFTQRAQTHVTDWLAYPEYKPPDTLATFVLYPGLFYTSSIEWAASAMEMSAVAGCNSALLAYNHWHDVEDKTDQLPKAFKHSEL